MWAKARGFRGLAFWGTDATNGDQEALRDMWGAVPRRWPLESSDCPADALLASACAGARQSSRGDCLVCLARRFPEVCQPIDMDSFCSRRPRIKTDEETPSSCPCPEGCRPLLPQPSHIDEVVAFPTIRNGSQWRHYDWKKVTAVAPFDGQMPQEASEQEISHGR
jgi:hypothetical protein